MREAEIVGGDEEIAALAALLDGDFPATLVLAGEAGIGKTTKEAAAALYVTPKTVETKRSRIYAKLGIRSRSELARRFGESKL